MRTPRSTAADQRSPRQRGGASPHSRGVPVRPLPSRPSTPPTRLTPRTPLTPEVEAELAAIATAAGCELLHAEWKGGVLRLILDLPENPADPAAGPAVGASSSGRDGHNTPGAPGAPGVPDVPGAPGRQAAPPPDAPQESGVSLADCEHVAKLSSALLDVLDFGNGRYLLEVSSPGLDRQLYRPADYRRFLGRLARVTFDPHTPDGRRRTVVARLAAADLGAGSVGPTGPTGSTDSNSGEVTLVDDRTGERFVLRLADILLARLEVELGPPPAARPASGRRASAGGRIKRQG